MAATLQPRRVAVLGGGPAAMAAALALTDPQAEGRYEVTVYQPGWRLGGKCASGRNMRPGKGKRIEEHGLHVWFGFYENAFRVMREVYAELNRRPGLPLATIDDAFKGCDEVILYDRQGSGWRRFTMSAPRNPLTPGAAPPGLPDFWEIARGALDWAAARFEELRSASPEAFAASAPQTRLTPGWFRNAAGAVGVGAGLSDAPGGENLLALARGIAHHRHAAGTLPLPGVHLAALQILGNAPAASLEHLLARLLCRFRDWLWERVVCHRVESDAELRLFFTMFDTFASAASGIVEDGVLTRGWHAINDRELCEWLRSHGAKQVTVGATPAQRCPVLRAIYDVAFGYPNGVIEDANVAAGTAMNDLLRLLFTYRGSLIYKMQAGMGDTVLAPFYEVLSARGVSFSFFSNVTQLRLSADGSMVDEIALVRQVELAQGTYEPLVSVEELPCWPSEPLWDQLADGRALRARGVDFELESNPLKRPASVLRRGADFDAVVLAIPVGALPQICAPIAQRHERFRQMLDAAQTVPTQAFQLWLSRSPEEMGFADGAHGVAGTYVEPLDTVCDMTHLLGREEWQPADGVEGIAYFCGVLDDRPNETPGAATKRVGKNVETFVSDHMAAIMPGSQLRAGGFDWSVLAGAGARKGAGRIAAQYWRANVSASERYVLTPAGSVEHRLQAGDSGVGNLVLAGDWTLNGIDGGCVEAAVLSGLQAARALTGGSGELHGESPTWLSDASRRAGWLGPARRILSGGRSPRTGGAGAPAYVEFGGRATTPPPFPSTGGRFQGFVLKGDARRIELLIRRTLSDPANGTVEYRPLFGEHVLMLTGAFARVSSEAPGFRDWGHVDEAQISLWVPVLAGRTVGTRFHPERMCMSVPFIVVNNAMSYAGGREVYGYPKTLGRFTPAAGKGDPVAVEVFGGDFKPANNAGWHTLFEIEKVKGAAARKAHKGSPKLAPQDAGKVARWIEQHGAAMWGAKPDIGLLADIIDGLLDKRARQVFLKQFRDAALPGRACYQAVIEAPIQVTSASWLASFHEWDVTVHPLDSHPVAKELGVESQRTRFTFELDMDMVAEPGAVVAP